MAGNLNLKNRPQILPYSKEELVFWEYETPGHNRKRKYILFIHFFKK
jgi:hypothetical protein